MAISVLDQYRPMLPAECDSYDEITRDFAWSVPARYNIANDVCDKWADGSQRLALIVEQADRTEARYTFDDLHRLSVRFGNALLARGIVRGDRVAIFVRRARRKRRSIFSRSYS